MTPGERSDEAIAHAIRTRLTWDPEIEGAAIAVTVMKGTAILEGTVRGYQRAAAERIARETPGVEAVDSRLRLADPFRPGDETIARMADTALAADPAIPAAQIVVTVHDGIVELTGEVSRGAERMAAEAAIIDLPGVVDVRNHMTVTEAPVGAAQIVTTIEEAFVAEAHAAAVGIAAQVDGGRVTLTGTTPTPHHRQLAERAAWGIAGVSDVRNELRVEP
jgi:osmotically-inducible protein OsmY